MLEFLADRPELLVDCGSSFLCLLSTVPVITFPQMTVVMAKYIQMAMVSTGMAAPPEMCKKITSMDKSTHWECVRRTGLSAWTQPTASADDI